MTPSDLWTRLTRRDAYLITWGLAYVSLGTMSAIAHPPLFPLWFGMFASTGVVAVAAGVTRWPLVQSVGFTALAGAAAFRAIWHFLALVGLQPGEVGPALVELLPMTVWATVAVAQVIVAGWPLDSATVERQNKGQ